MKENIIPYGNEIAFITKFKILRKAVRSDKMEVVLCEFKNNKSFFFLVEFFD